jgi:hypothetical protein
MDDKAFENSVRRIIDGYLGEENFKNRVIRIIEEHHANRDLTVKEVKRLKEAMGEAWLHLLDNEKSKWEETLPALILLQIDKYMKEKEKEMEEAYEKKQGNIDRGINRFHKIILTIAVIVSMFGGILGIISFFDKPAPAPVKNTSAPVKP